MKILVSTTAMLATLLLAACSRGGGKLVSWEEYQVIQQTIDAENQAARYEAVNAVTEPLDLAQVQGMYSELSELFPEAKDLEFSFLDIQEKASALLGYAWSTSAHILETKPGSQMYLLHTYDMGNWFVNSKNELVVLVPKIENENAGEYLVNECGPIVGCYGGYYIPHTSVSISYSLLPSHEVPTVDVRVVRYKQKYLNVKYNCDKFPPNYDALK